MKQLAKIVTLALAALPAAAAYAQYSGTSGLTNTTVKALLANGRDDQHVMVQGRITKHMGGEDYEFTDATGSIAVEIDNKLWAGLPAVNDKNEVRVTGEFERKWSGRVKIDADRIEVLR